MSTELEKIAELKKQIDALEQQVKDRDKISVIKMGTVVRFQDSKNVRVIVKVNNIYSLVDPKDGWAGIEGPELNELVNKHNLLFLATSLEEYYKDKFADNEGCYLQ